jgi:hypothetical protein
VYDSPPHGQTHLESASTSPRQWLSVSSLRVRDHTVGHRGEVLLLPALRRVHARLVASRAAANHGPPATEAGRTRQPRLLTAPAPITRVFPEASREGPDWMVPEVRIRCSVRMALHHARPFRLPERRFRRLEIGPCSTCGSPWVTVHDRTTDGLILDCVGCERRWIILKPSSALSSTPTLTPPAPH